MKHFFVGWFIAREPLDFSALDDEPVWLFNCMIGPPDQPGYHLRLLEFSSRLLKSAEFVEIARKGVAHLQEFFNSLKDDARIGSALNRLAMEEARFRSAAGEADWAGCQAAFARMGTVSVEIEAELRELGLDRPVQEQLERSRTDLAGSADRAKQVWLYQAIQELAGCRLDSIAIEVNGQSVSIRATDKEHARREDLCRSIASLPGLVGYRTEIRIEGTPVAGPGPHVQEGIVSAGEALRTDCPERSRLEEAIFRASGTRLRSLKVVIEGRNVSIEARASHFWQRRGLRRMLESLPCLAGYRIDLEVG